MTAANKAPALTAANDTRHAAPLSLGEKPRGFLPFTTRPFLFASLFATDQVLGTLARPTAAEDAPEIASSDTSREVGRSEATEALGSSYSTMGEVDDQLSQGPTDSGSETSSRVISNPIAPPTPGSQDIPRVVVADSNDVRGADIGVAGGATASDAGGVADSTPLPGSIIGDSCAPNCKPDVSDYVRICDSSPNGEAGIELSSARISSALDTLFDYHANSSPSDAVQDLLHTIQPALDVALPTLGGVTQMAAELPEAVVSTVTPIIAGAAATVTTVTNMTSDLAPAVANIVTPVVDMVSPALTGVTETVASLVHDTVEPVVGIVAPTVNAALTPALELSDDVLTAIEPVVRTVAPTVAAVGNTANTLTADVLPLAQSASEIVAPTLGTVSDAARDLSGDVLATAEPLIETVIPPLTAVSEVATGLASDALAAAEPVVGTVTPSLIAVSEAATGLASDALAAAESVVETVTPSLSAVSEVTTGSASDALAAAEPVVDDANAISTLVEAVPDAVASIPTVISDVAPTMTEQAPKGGPTSEMLPTALADSADNLGIEDSPVGDIVEISQSVIESHESSKNDPLTRIGESEMKPPIEILNSEEHSAPSAEDGNFLGSAGTIDFHDQPLPPASDADATFVGGQYTDYGVAITRAADISKVASSIEDPATVDPPREHPTEAPKAAPDDAVTSAPLVAELTGLNDGALRGDDGLI